ncbi:MAG: protein translocase subunit SecF [Candidatus Gracilibacteria bacterium]
MKKYLTWQLIAIFVMTAILGFINLPYSMQEKILPSGSNFLEQSKIMLGLDLQGGTQLDYKIDLSGVQEADQESIIDGVQEVITRRVNVLGVSEPNIYTSNVSDEYHIIVELAGINDLEEAKSVLGKSIQLEFKEQSTTLDDTEKANRLGYAQDTLARILNGEDFKTVGEEQQTLYPEFAIYTTTELADINSISEDIKPYLEGLNTGDTVSQVIEGSDGKTYDLSGATVDLQGDFVIQVADHQSGEERTETAASHILIGWDESDLASDRTKDEAYSLISEIKEKAANGEDFAALAQQYSEDTGSASNGGDLGFFTKGKMVAEFETAAFTLPVGEISEIVETQFGYHLIKVTDEKVENVDSYALNKIIYLTMPNSWVATELTGEHFVHADVQFDQNGYTPYVTIEFDEEGGAMFEEITGRNVGKPLAIFVGGDLISAPNVNTKISGGSAQITGDFSVEEATNLARDLNTGAIPAPVTLSGQYTISSTLGSEALTKSLHAGMIGIIILAIAMILYYRLPGVLAVLALAIYSVILIFAIKIALPLPLAILISFVIFGVIIATILKSNEGSFEKFTTFILSLCVLFFVTFVLSNTLTLTLAGIAGVVLSIGMAVDANILIFERIKEELKSGKPHALAIETGFKRAWDSIRDSNFSSLLTCAILFYFGSSIIRGFAFNLALGILISIFTAITVTRTFLRSTVGQKALEKEWLFGVSKKERKEFRIMDFAKTWISISAVAIIISLVATMMFGLNWGLDFKGGTLMEVKFTQEVTSDQITQSLTEIQEELNSPSSEKVAQEESAIIGESILVVDGEESTTEIAETTTEFGTPIIVKTGEGNFIIRIKHISEETHNAILEKFTTNLGELEEIRFTTVGPTIGSTLQKKAAIAIVVAILMIVIYVSIAFRKVPRSIGPWRFGVCTLIALAHDVIILVGAFAILGKFMGVEIDALFLTALLTVLGFSVHDTIVVFDRLRENLRIGSHHNFYETANASISQTIARSINTSMSTLITLTALLIFGAGSIFYFILALAFGIIVGTYSSIFIATPILVWWHNREKKA